MPDLSKSRSLSSETKPAFEGIILAARGYAPGKNDTESVHLDVVDEVRSEISHRGLPNQPVRIPDNLRLK